MKRQSKVKILKRPKTLYAKRIKPTFALYGLLCVSCFIPALIVIPTASKENVDIAAAIAFGVVFVLFLLISVAFLFSIIPNLKIAQAHEDFSKSDFTPYVSKGESEVFENEYVVCKYVFTASPFDSDECVTLQGEEEITNYLSQYSRERLVSEENDYPVPYAPFYISYFFGGKGVKIRAEKKLKGDEIEVTITEIHRAEFTEKGLLLGDELYDYEYMEADISSDFSKRSGFAVILKIELLLSDEGVLFFNASSRAAEVIKRFVKQINKEHFDYLLKDPLNAYEQTALQLGLKKLK